MSILLKDERRERRKVGRLPDVLVLKGEMALVVIEEVVCS